MLYDPEIKKRALAHIERFGPAPTHFKIAAMAGTGKNVLELGCATGYVSALMFKNGCRITGIELDPEAAAAAQPFCRQVITGDVNDPDVITAAGKDFDVVVAGDVLEHLPDPFSVLVSLHQVIKPEGIVLVSLPNVAYWRMRMDLLLGRFDYQDTGLLDRTHLRFFTVNSFIQMAQETGFIVQDITVNDAGFPGSELFRRLPFCRKIVDRFSHFLAGWRPNLFSFHSIFVLVPHGRA